MQRHLRSPPIFFAIKGEKSSGFVDQRRLAPDRQTGEKHPPSTRDSAIYPARTKASGFAVFYLAPLAAQGATIPDRIGSDPGH
jgi:hypothetical protein